MDSPQIDMSGHTDSLHENSRGLGPELSALTQMLGTPKKRRTRQSKARDLKQITVTPDPIPAEIRAELDITPEWWDRQYRALERAVARNAAEFD